MSVHLVTTRSGRKARQVRWREGERQRSRNFPDTPQGRKDARAFDRELDRLRRLGELADELERRRVTVQDLVLEWVARRTDLGARTRENYARHFDTRILPALGNRQAASLRPGDINAWIAQLRANGDGNPTILKATAALQSVLSLAVTDGLIPVNPVAGATKPAQRRTRIPILIPPTAVERMRLDLQLRQRERDVMLLELLAYAGLRPESEAICLRWENVRERSIVVHDTKRKRERVVPMIDPLRESLARWRMRTGRPAGDKLVIPGPEFNAWTESDWRNWQRRVFKPCAHWATDLPLDVRARDLRSSFVSLLIRSGNDIVEVSRQVGHSPEICLRDYALLFANVDPLDRRPAAEIIDTARNRVRSQFARFQPPALPTYRKTA